MRNNQISVKIQRFGSQTTNLEKEQTFDIYADSDNVYEALIDAFKESYEIIKIEEEKREKHEKRHG